MGLIDELINKLFPKRESGKPVQVQELLERSSEYHQAFESWKSSGAANELLKGIEKSYHLQKNQELGIYPIHLFNSPAANGFALTFHPAIGARVFQFLLDYWRDRVLALGYRLTNTDRRIEEKDTYIQTTEKHYLKPPINRKQAKSEQAYGNILLEYVLIDRQPSYLKLMNTTYNDHQFTKAKPYQELIDHLFSQSTRP